MEFSVPLDTLMNWEIFWAISLLLLDNTLESQYFTCDFLNVSTPIHSHYDNVVLTSLQDQANSIVTENLYTTLFRLCKFHWKELTYLASWLLSIWKVFEITVNHNFYHILYKSNLLWTKDVSTLNTTFHSS